MSSADVGVSVGECRRVSSADIVGPVFRHSGRRRRTTLADTQADTQSVTLVYDRVWHASLLKKLDDVDVPLGLVGWIGAFLRDRQASLLVGTTSISQPLTVGVPQGSPLSPVLFLVFINGLLRALTGQASVQAFADDIVIWWTLGKGECGSSHQNALLAEVLAWARCWRMIFNPAKCKFLVISRLCREPLPQLRLDGVPLECVSNLRYLGVWLDSKLCWREHIAQVSQKALG